MKKRLAVIGGGAHTIPSYRAMLKLIANEYELTLLSEFHLDENLNVPEYAIKSVSSGKKGSRWRTFLLFVHVLKSFLSKRPHVIHSHSTYPSGLVAIIFGKLFHIPVIVCLDAAEGSGIPEINFGDLLNARRSRLNKWVMNQASAVTALTQFQYEEVRGNLDFKKSIQIIPRGVDPVQYKPKTKNSFSQPLKFLSVAYLHPVKDHETMLRAFQLISQQVDASITLVGKDYERGRIQELAKQLGIEDKVIFEGFVSHDRIMNYYHQSDFFLHTSLFESQAMAVVEAMAAGLLVCGTHVGIIADLASECCVAVETKDYVGLANAVIELVNHPEKQTELRSAAFKWVDEHSLQWTTQQYLNLYKGLIR